MNFFPAEIAGGGIRLADGTVIPAPGQARASEGKRVTLGIRPEDFAIAPEGPIHARVKVVEPTGADTIIAAEVGGIEAAILVRERITAAAGEEIRLAVAPEDTRLFDPETGAAI
ncbi:TOBE domain-containing protein [Amaricoccus sp. W119]|uniref:TOBE domain-containing protein n=1 Tax=Amaricoccus sp. W119 TaxID=3391833 RepID=UPI0039A70F2B